MNEYWHNLLSGKSIDLDSLPQPIDLITHPLNRRLVISNHKEITAGADVIKNLDINDEESDSFLYVQLLILFLRYSKISDKLEIAAANAITILTHARFPFSKMDLSKIKITGANISFGIFDSTDFSYANLNSITMEACWLRNAKFKGASMKGVILGERPTIEINLTNQMDMAECMAISNDGSILLVGINNPMIGVGTINVYNTKNYTMQFAIRNAHSRGVKAISFHPTKRIFASGSYDRTINVWSLDTYQKLFSFLGGDLIFSMPKTTDDFEKSLLNFKQGHDYDSGMTVSGLIHAYEFNRILFIFSPSSNLWKAIAAKRDFHSLYWMNAKRIRDKPLEFKEVEIPSESTLGRELAKLATDNNQTIAASNTFIEIKDLVTILNKIHLFDGLTASAAINGHAQCVDGISFQPDGDYLASGSWDRTVRVWNITTNKLFAILMQGASGSVQFDPSGKWLAACGNVTFDHEGNKLPMQEIGICIWSTDNFSTFFVIKSEHVNSFRFDPVKPNILISANSSESEKISTVSLWDVKSKAQLSKFESSTLKISRIAIHPTGEWLALTNWNSNMVWKLDCETMTVTDTFSGHAGSIQSLIFHPRNEYIFALDRNHQLHGWSSKKPRINLPFKEFHHAGITSITVSSKHGWIASGCRYGDPLIRVWIFSNNQLTYSHSISSLASVTGTIFSLAAHPIQNWLFINHNDSSTNHLTIWDVQNKVKLYNFESKKTLSGGLAFHPTGKWIAYLDDKKINLWDIDTRSVVNSFKSGNSPFFFENLAIHKNGEWLAWVENNKFKVWELSSSTLIFEQEGKDFEDTLEFHPNKCWLATNSRGIISLWDIMAKKMIWIFTGHSSRINKLIFSQNGDWLISASSDRSVRIWDMRTLKTKLVLSLSGEITALRLLESNGKKYLLTGGSDNALRLWQIITTDEKDRLDAIMQWSSNQSILLAPGMHITDATGLTDEQISLLKTRGAEGECIKTSTTPKEEFEGKIFSKIFSSTPPLSSGDLLEKLKIKYSLTDSSIKSLEKGLRRAASTNAVDDIYQFLKLGCNIDAADDNPSTQRTALHWSVINKHEESAKVLLTKGARFDLKDASNKTVEDYLRHGETTIISSMILKKKFVSSILHKAIEALLHDNTEEAILHYKEAVSYDPVNYMALHNLGYCYHLKSSCTHNKEDLTKAEEYFEKASNINNSSATHIELANLLYRQNRISEAIIHLELVVANREQASTESLTYLRNGKPILIKVLHDELDKLGKLNIKTILLAYLLLGKCYMKTKQAEKALAITEEMCKYITHTEQALDCCLLGYLYKTLKDYTKAAFYFSKAITLRKDYDFAEMKLKTCHERIGNKLIDSGMFRSSAKAPSSDQTASETAASFQP